MTIPPEPEKTSSRARSSAGSPTLALLLALLLPLELQGATQSSGYGEWEVWQSLYGDGIKRCYMRTRSSEGDAEGWLTYQGVIQHDLAHVASLTHPSLATAPLLVRDVEYQIDDQPRQPAWASPGSGGELQLTLPPLRLRRGTRLELYLPLEDGEGTLRFSFSLMGFSAGWRHISRCSRGESGPSLSVNEIAEPVGSGRGTGSAGVE